MKCMRCGVKIPTERVFCEDCALSMEKNPVKADTPVVLPPKAFAPTSKRPTHHRPRRKEDPTARLRVRVRVLGALCALELVGLALCGLQLAYFLTRQPADDPRPDPGQNYSTGSIPTPAHTTAPTTTPTTEPTTTPTTEPNPGTP